MHSMMTLQEIYETEPALKQLEREVLACRGKGQSHEYSLWYQRFKPRLCRLVGFEARNPALSSCEAYDTVCNHLLSIFEGSSRHRAGGETHG